MSQPTLNFEPYLHHELEVVGLEDAAVAESARLSAGGELDESGGEGAWSVDIDAECDALFSLDDITIRGSDVPDAPGYALLHLLDAVATLAVRHASGHHA